MTKQAQAGISVSFQRDNQPTLRFTNIAEIMSRDISRCATVGLCLKDSLETKEQCHDKKSNERFQKSNNHSQRGQFPSFLLQFQLMEIGQSHKRPNPYSHMYLNNFLPFQFHFVPNIASFSMDPVVCLSRLESSCCFRVSFRFIMWTLTRVVYLDRALISEEGDIIPVSPRCKPFPPWILSHTSSLPSQLPHSLLGPLSSHWR
jgi:hypothetical protein